MPQTTQRHLLPAPTDAPDTRCAGEVSVWQDTKALRTVSEARQHVPGCALPANAAAIALRDAVVWRCVLHVGASDNNAFMAALNTAFEKGS